jgi:hypothetical protein
MFSVWVSSPLQLLVLQKECSMEWVAIVLGYWRENWEQRVLQVVSIHLDRDD